MTPQQVFDKVVSHLRTQNKRATNSDGTCRYRGDGGLKCAVGCIISDDEYSPSMEGTSLASLLARPHGRGLSESVLQLLQSHSSLLQELQRIHDSFDTEWWEREFKRVAMAYNLTLAPPNG